MCIFKNDHCNPKKQRHINTTHLDTKDFPTRHHASTSIAPTRKNQTYTKECMHGHWQCQRIQ